MSKLGSSDFSAIYLGDTEVVKAYLGTDVVYQKGSSLPYDAQIAYLETDGAAYINTGINPSSTTRCVITMNLPTLTMGAWFFGSRISASSGQFGLMYSTDATRWDWRFGSKYYRKTDTPSAGQYVFDNYTSGAPRQLYVNGTALTATKNSFSSNYPMFLFTLNVAGIPSTTTIHAGVQFVSAKFYDSSTLLADFIPVRVGSVGYLYDNVSGNLHGNAGSGSFVLGSDV